ncbi:MAG: GPW/gp25 family protein, partial [Nakamurella sp.]
MPGLDFVGAGWAFPLNTDATGGVALVVGDREIEEAIRLILATAPGERPMRPEFGCRVHDHVFAPINASTAGAIAGEVRYALEMWEPRIDVEDVLVSFD